MIVRFNNMFLLALFLINVVTVGAFAAENTMVANQHVNMPSQVDNQEALIANFAKNSQLYFFYTSTCPYCHKFAPILKEFTDHYGINIVAITQNGGILPSFPDSKQDTGQSTLFHVTAVPALFAIEPSTHQVIVVGYGLMDGAALKVRIANIAQQFIEE